ncbi:MAG: hypothetical protein NTV74_05710 [Euryarchaeota archaeon]|nr:hypothetical protein [Euryarchaeota archaeon]
MKKSIKIVKTFILIAVVGLLLSVASTKTVSAYTQNTVGIIVITDEGEKCVQVQMNDTQIAALKQNIYDFEGWLEQNNPLADLKLDECETKEIRDYVDKLIESLPENVQFISTDEIIKLITPEKNLYWWMSLFIRQPIISIGDSGRSFIPFSQYEWYIGLGIALHMGIWTGYTYNEMKGLKGGFTTFTRIIPPNITSEKYSGTHLVGVRGLKGLYINIGALGYKESYGPVVLLGRAYPLLALQK